MMKKIRLVLCFLTIALMTGVSFGQNASPRTHLYLTEFKKPGGISGNASIIDVVFFEDFQPRKVEDFLRAEIEKSLKILSTRGEIMATGWRSNGDTSTEKMIVLPDGSKHLIYDPKTSKILTFKQAYGDNLLPPLKKP